MRWVLKFHAWMTQQRYDLTVRLAKRLGVEVRPEDFR